MSQTRTMANQEWGHSIGSHGSQGLESPISFRYVPSVAPRAPMACQYPGEAGVGTGVGCCAGVRGTPLVARTEIYLESRFADWLWNVKSVVVVGGWWWVSCAVDSSVVLVSTSPCKMQRYNNRGAIRS